MVPGRCSCLDLPYSIYQLIVLCVQMALRIPYRIGNTTRHANIFHLCRAQRLSLRKRPKADNGAARPFIPHTSAGRARDMADSPLTDGKFAPAKPERLVDGAQPHDGYHTAIQVDTLKGGLAHDPTVLLNKSSGSNTAQQAQRPTSTTPGIPKALGRPAFAPAAREGSALQAWVPRRRNWASFDALDDLPDLSGHQQAEAGKPCRDLSATRQVQLAGCQRSEDCFKALCPLTSSNSNIAPVSRDDRPGLGTAQCGGGSAHTPGQGRLHCDDSHSSAPQSPSRSNQPDMSKSAKPGFPLGALVGSKLPQCMMQASDTARRSALAVSCASAEPWAAGGREHQQQPAAAAGTIGPRWKLFAAPRLVSKATGGNASCAGKGVAHEAQRAGSQGRPSGLQLAAEGNKRQPDLARMACHGRNEAQQLGSSSVREQQALGAEVTDNTMQGDAPCAGDRGTDREPMISDSWADSDSSEHNEASHPQSDPSEQQVSRAAQQHMLSSQETGELSSGAECHRQQSTAQGRAAQESAKAGVSGMGLLAQEGGSGQVTGRKRLKRLYNAPVALDGDADTGSGHSTEVCRIWHAQCSALQETLCVHELVPDLICIHSAALCGRLCCIEIWQTI